MAEEENQENPEENLSQVIDDESVIILKEGDENLEQDLEQNVEQDTAEATPKENIWQKIKSINKKNIIIFVAIMLLFVVLLTLFFITSPKEMPIPEGVAIAKSLKEDEIIKQDLKSSNIEKVISKATLLYQEYPEDALDLFGKISIYNQSLSLYNLGVANMAIKKYDKAFEYFKRAIQTRENICESALNAGVCALMLGKKEEFRLYMDLAAKNLYTRVNSTMYEYLYMLISYYQNRPIHTIAAGDYKFADEYSKTKNKMLASSYLSILQIEQAINTLSKNHNDDDLPSLGLLSASIGKYDDAKNYLRDAITKNIDTNNSKEALILTLLKKGELYNAGNELASAIKSKLKLKQYPIKTSLKQRLFDLSLAQDYFSNKVLLDKDNFLGMLFYFTPYKIINPHNTVEMIDKGQMSIDSQDLANAKRYLQGSLTLSGIQGGIVLGVKLAINNRIINANSVFKRIETSYKGDDILEYNLALSYAQMGDYAKAYKHFSRCFFLNKTNLEAGIFSVVLAPYAGANEKDKLKRLMGILQAKDTTQYQFYLAMLNFYNDNFVALAQWLEHKKTHIPRYILLDIFAADKLERYANLRTKTNLFRKLYPKEFLSIFLDLYAQNKMGSIKKQSFGFQGLMGTLTFNKDPIYYGSQINRDLYIKLALLTGNLQKIRLEFQARLEVEVSYPMALIEGLAIINIYLQHFEQAFVLYNQLIDEYRSHETRTLLLASIAAIGANHKENAIALLELAIIQNKRNFEARYALALLYMEIGNYAGAAVQLSNVDKGIHQSNYYDFELDL